MKTLITGLSFMLSISITHAQSSLGKQVNDAKFQIVKKTAEFLSTDKATFGSNTKTKCEGCATYDNVIKFATDNKLAKVDALISELEKTPVDTSSNKWKTSLTTFKDNVVDKITVGSDRGKRKDLPTYKDYVNNLNTIISNVKTTGSAQTASASPDENAAMQKPESTAAKAGDTAGKTNKQQQTVTDEEASPEASLIDKAMPWLPYIIAGILLLLLITVWRSGTETKKRLVILEKDKKEADKESSYLKRDNADLQLKIKALEEDLKNKEIDLQATETRLRNAETNYKNAAQSNVSVPEGPVIEKPAAKISVQKPKPVVANIKYARYADMGDGFSNAELLDKADGETIFELVIMPNNNTGEFKVASHAAAQHYALSNAQYFLGKTCQYNSFPSEDATIQTDAPGTIKLTGSKWTIVSPAKISFR